MAGEIVKTMRLDGAMTLEKFREMVERNPDNELYRFSLGKALFDAGQYDKAIEHLDFALNKRPDWCQVCILLGRCCAYLNFPDHARNYYNKALELAVEQDNNEMRTEVLRCMKQLG